MIARRMRERMMHWTSETIGRRGMLKTLAAAGMVGAVELAPLGLGLGGRALAAGTLPFKGVIPIGSTPVNDADVVQYDQLANQVTFLRRGRVPGIAWPQIASGWTTLSERERLTGAEALVAAAKGGGTAVIVGVQSPDEAAVARYARHATRIGADGLICIPPTSITAPDALLAYYQRVGKLSDLPLFVQAVGDMNVDLLVHMVQTIPTLRYVKDESGEPLERVAELLRRTEGRVGDFSGRGANLMITEMERGFAGACPFVSLSDVYQRCWEAWQAGDRRKAFEIFGAIQAANTMFSQSSVEPLIARGVFKPGTALRFAPQAAGSGNARYYPATTPEQIQRVIHDYLQPYVQA